MAHLSPLESLPTEMLQGILAALPDTTSLEATALTRPRLFHAFKAAENTIVKSVVGCQIGSELLHDALAVHASIKVDDCRIKEVEAILAQYCVRDQKPFHALQEWTLAQAHILAKTQKNVEYFSNKFIAQITGIPPFSSETSTASARQPLTGAEKNRIYRSFYRFEIYAKIFESGFMSDNMQDQHCLNFAPWENEQLCCIKDFLANIITRGQLSSFRSIFRTDTNLGDL